MPPLPAKRWGGCLDAMCLMPCARNPVVVGDFLAWIEYTVVVEQACAIFMDELYSQMRLNASKKARGERSDLEVSTLQDIIPPVCHPTQPPPPTLTHPVATEPASQLQSNLAMATHAQRRLSDV